MVSTTQAIIQQAGTFVMACLLVGGSIMLAAMGKTVPMWLVGFDGAAVAFVYGNAQSFVQARTALPTANALADLTGKYHQLAIAGTTTTTPTQTGGTGTEVPSGRTA